MVNLYCEKIITPIGNLIAIANDKNVLILQFEEQVSINKILKDAKVINKPCEITYFLRKEIDLYFEGKLKNFKTPLSPEGTVFQHSVWKELQNISYGEIQNYSNIASSIGLPNARRAVANASARNKILIIIPCHRVIRKSGNLSGYNAGIDRKKWLLDFEKQHC